MFVIESRDFCVSSRSNTELLFLIMIFDLRTSRILIVLHLPLKIHDKESESGPRDF